MKVYFKFDRESVPELIRTQIASLNGNLISLDGETFAFNFDPVVFTHAWQVLTKSPTGFGSDLSMYLAGTYDFFLRNSTSEALCLTVGTTDFKRRISEDLSVALASLFMVNSFGVEWNTIAQIPSNRNLSKLRPDFECFDSAGNRLLYEAKGRSNIASVIDAINKAVSQIKSYPESAIQKLAFITYFCSDERAFPSYTFMIDPQLPDTVLPDQDTAEQLHFLNVLNFGGFYESKKEYLSLLKARFSLKSALAEGTVSKRLVNRVNNAKEAFTIAFDQEAGTKKHYSYLGESFIIRTTELSAGSQTFKISAGIHSETKNRVLAEDSSRLLDRSEKILTADDGISVFNDGTLFMVSVG